MVDGTFENAGGVAPFRHLEIPPNLPPMKKRQNCHRVTDYELRLDSRLKVFRG